MKRHLPLAAVLVFICSAFCYAQPQPAASPSPAAKPKPKMSKAQMLKKLSANETALWKAFQNKDAKPFKAWLAADSLVVGEEGTTSKSQLTEMLPNMPCEFKSFTLSDWKLTMLNSSTALLTYKGVQDGSCAGTPLPAAVWASSIWVNRGGKWQAAFHQETTAKQ